MSAMPDITELALLLRSCTTLGLPEVSAKVVAAAVEV